MGACCCKCFKGKKKDEGIKDINRNRSCTDLMFCGIFIVAFVISVAIILAGYTQGNVESLFFGTDANGMTCGSLNNNMGDKAVSKRDTPFIVYPRIQEDMVRQAQETNLNSLTETDLNNLKFYGVCVAAWP